MADQVSIIEKNVNWITYSQIAQNGNWEIVDVNNWATGTGNPYITPDNDYILFFTWDTSRNVSNPLAFDTNVSWIRIDFRISSTLQSGWTPLITGLIDQLDGNAGNPSVINIGYKGVSLYRDVNKPISGVGAIKDAMTLFVIDSRFTSTPPAKLKPSQFQLFRFVG